MLKLKITEKNVPGPANYCHIKVYINIMAVISRFLSGFNTTITTVTKVLVW